MARGSPAAWCGGNALRGPRCWASVGLWPPECSSPHGIDLRVIPGSHRRAEQPIDMEHGYASRMGPHPDEVKIIAPAGSVILFNSAALWHSGTFNYTPAARLGLTVHFAPGPGERG